MGNIPIIDYSNYVWPPPPDQPRIKLLDIISSDLDVREPDISERMFGLQATFSFQKPFDIAVDKRNTIYVSDDQKRDVIVLNLETKKVGSLFNSEGWSWPMGIAYDEIHDLLAVADAYKQKVYIFDLLNEKLKTVLGQLGEFKNPTGVAFDPQRSILYVCDSKENKIDVYDYTGNFIRTLTSIETSGIYYPLALEVDKDGNLYVVDSMNFRFVIFDPNGNMITAIGEHGDGVGMFARPKGIAVDSDGHIYVTDAIHNVFQVFDKENRTYGFTGGTGSGPGQFLLPMGIHIDQNNKIYVVDQYNRRIQIFQYITDQEAKEGRP